MRVNTQDMVQCNYKTIHHKYRSIRLKMKVKTECFVEKFLAIYS